MSLGRTLRVKERVSFSVRIEFTNIFNRAFFNNPTSTNSRQTQVRVTTGLTGNTASGFGYLPTTVGSPTVNISPRSGTLVARITF